MFNPDDTIDFVVSIQNGCEISTGAAFGFKPADLAGFLEFDINPKMLTGDAEIIYLRIGLF